MKALKEYKQKSFVSPQLARLSKKYFSDPNWIFEEKLDGIRCIVVCKNKKVKLYSRNRNLLNHKFPSLLASFEKQKLKNFIIDGEIVAFDKNRSSFSKLQQYKKEKVSVYFYAFDLLYFDKYDTKSLTQIERKKLLKQKFQFSSKLRYSSHISKEGLNYYKKACKKHLEGIIAKKKDAKYLSKRTSNWLKFKCSNSQEFIIIGYTESEKKSRIGFGSLLLGYFDKGTLRYAGKVGTGFDFSFLKSFYQKLQKIETTGTRLKGLKIKKAHFVRLKYVAQVEFSEWTKDLKLRHPRFIALRSDKSLKKVIKEG